jgi:hypothetical protein
MKTPVGMETTTAMQRERLKSTPFVDWKATVA